MIQPKPGASKAPDHLPAMGAAQNQERKTLGVQPGGSGRIYRILRGSGLFGVIVCWLGVAQLVNAPWLAGPAPEIGGEDLSWLLVQFSDTPGAFLHFYVIGAFTPSLFAVPLGLTSGVHMPRGRYVAIVVVALTAWAGVATANSSFNGEAIGYESWTSEELHLFDIGGVITYGLVLVLIVAAVLLLLRRYSSYHGLVVFVTAVTGGYELLGVYELGGMLPEGTSLTPASWLSGCGVLAAAGCAALAGYGAARIPGDGEALLSRIWRVNQEFAKSFEIAHRGPGGPPGYQERPHFRTLVLCGRLGVLTFVLAVVIAWVGGATISEGLPTGLIP